MLAGGSSLKKITHDGESLKQFRGYRRTFLKTIKIGGFHNSNCDFHSPKLIGLDFDAAKK
jgi:hypothetical protein